MAAGQNSLLIDRIPVLQGRCQAPVGIRRSHCDLKIQVVNTGQPPPVRAMT